MLTGGHARGRALSRVPAVGVRPTSARVREALFSMVGQDLHGQRVLDAFGGSGLLALEAWSRGAEVVCVERGRAAWAVLTANLKALGADVKTVRGDVLARVAGLGMFDLVLADPPYDEDPERIGRGLAPAVGGTLVLEMRADRPDPVVPGLTLERRRAYGDTALCVLVREGT